MAILTPTPPPAQVQRQLATRSHGKRIVLIVVLLLGGGLTAAILLLQSRGQPSTEGSVAAPTTRPWLKQAETYPDPEKPVEKAPAPPVDTVTPELAKLRAEILAMKLKMDELDKRKGGTTIVQPSQGGQPAVK